MPEGAQSRSDLAEAGRKKLEAFRNRKSKKKKKKVPKQVVDERDNRPTTAPVAQEKANEPVKVTSQLHEKPEKPEKPVTKGPSELVHSDQNKLQSGSSLPVKVEEYTSATSILDDERSRSGQSSGQSFGSFGGSQVKEDGFTAGIRDKVEPSTTYTTERTPLSLQTNTEPGKSKSSSSSLAASYSMLSDLYMSSPQSSPKKKESPASLSVFTNKDVDSRKGKDVYNYQLPFTRAEEPAASAEPASSLRVDEGKDKERQSSNSFTDAVSASVSASEHPNVDEKSHKLVEQLRLEKELLANKDSSQAPSSAGQPSDYSQGSSKYKGASISEKDIEGLQAHLDLITREKYELQRGLESQQDMIDSLTKENMALTESFNAKAASSSVYTAEIEDLKEQVDTLAGAAERALEERDAALNGSAASADRAKALASEVIQLEESLLHARSNELKAEKQSSIALEKFEGLQSKLQDSIRERDALVSKVEQLKAGALNGVADSHTKNGRSNGEELRLGNGLSVSHPISEINALTTKAVGPRPITPTIAHSKTEMSALVDQLQRTTSFQTASMVQSIFSLLDDMSS